ncbi:MAG: glycosyltransferase family protein [Desulfobaccales bacterium]|nr:glycosyltransferase family protein [Desulfobaccales bacterium]
MARVIYGVHGTGHGHAVRALTVARHFPEHEFLFLSHGTAADLLKAEYEVVDCPNPETPVKGHKVAGAATLYSNLKVRSRSKGIIRRVLEVIERFQPEVAITDYEYFLPRASRLVGLPCLSLDHQHVITCCDHPVPWPQLPSYLITAWAVRRYFSAASYFLVTSFFQPPVKPGAKVKLLPSLLRESVLARRPQDGDHVVAYQGYATFKRFFPFLSAIQRPVLVYGFDRDHTAGNLRFKKNSEPGFLDDLASCRYVICGGGHSLISEALFYGKPVISFPVKNAFEQFLNAFYVGHLGYGRYFTGLRPPPEIIPAFEARLDDFRNNIRGGRFCGNPEIFALVQQFIQERKL